MNELESLKSIFKDRLFKIPDYQRGYAWATKHLTDFWEDLVNLPSGKFHYTGMLSLKRVDKSVWANWNEERWLVEERGCIFRSKSLSLPKGISLPVFNVYFGSKSKVSFTLSNL